MATGDQGDITNRLAQLLPGSWFPGVDNAPVLNSVLQIFAKPGSDIYELIQYAELQTRLATATDGWLDMIAYDFLGGRVIRAANQSDTSFRSRIRAEIFRERNTRQAIVQVLKDVTGDAPFIFEPWRPADCFCLGSGGLGVGRLGSRMMPGQTFVIAYEPPSTDLGLANIAGLGTSVAGLGTPRMAMPDRALADHIVLDADLYAAVESVRAAGTTLWVKIAPPLRNYPQVFSTDFSQDFA